MLKIQPDRIIIDGHEPTKEQCETMTLLANALSESNNFKTVEYRAGYAEFEKVGKADELKFAIGAPAPITVIFDSHITKVVYHGPEDIEFTVSGETKTGNAYDGAEYLFTVTLETGYVLDTVTLSSTNPDYGTLVDKTDTTFTILASAGGIYQTITLTSKLAVSRKSIDLTTLPGWSSLPSDTYSITIVAKADGYRDSEPSAAVTVEKAAETPTDCIVFTGESSDFTLSARKEWDGTVEYCTDATPWTTWDGTAISSSNKKLYLRGSGNTKFYASYGTRFVLSAKAGCSGNLNTLLEYSNPPTTLSASYCYAYMFIRCDNLTTAPALPATTLAGHCYESMFNGCTNLTTAPELPATTLASECYRSMFMGCTSLTTALALPATTLANSCYENMFSGCTNLTTAPELPATTLASKCYRSMFNGCTAFKVSSTKTGTYQYAWRIPTSGTISSTQSDWSAYMLKNTGGTFTSDPSRNTTYYVENKPI